MVTHFELPSISCHWLSNLLIIASDVDLQQNIFFIMPNIWPWVFHITHPDTWIQLMSAKFEKATKYLSLVTIKIFFECIFKFLKKKLNPNMTSKAPITHPNPSSVWYLAAGATKDQAQARNALDWIICHRQIYVEYLYIIVCNIGQSAIVRRHWIC